MPKYRAALVLAGVLLSAGCGTDKEESATTRTIVPADLARMVQKQQFGPLARGLRLDPESSGPSSNSKGAGDTVDPKDSGAVLAKAGRVRGYDLTYAAFSRPQPLGVILVSESVELFRTENAASTYLKKQLADFERFRGRTIEGVKIVRVEQFDIGAGDEGGGVRMTVRYPSHRATLFVTIAGFRHGRVVGSTNALLARDLMVSGDVERVADALDARIESVASAPAA